MRDTYGRTPSVALMRDITSPWEAFNVSPPFTLQTPGQPLCSHSHLRESVSKSKYFRRAGAAIHPTEQCRLLNANAHRRKILATIQCLPVSITYAIFQDSQRESDPPSQFSGLAFACLGFGKTGSGTDTVNPVRKQTQYRPPAHHSKSGND